MHGLPTRAPCEKEGKKGGKPSLFDLARRRFWPRLHGEAALAAARRGRKTLLGLPTTSKTRGQREKK